MKITNTQKKLLVQQAVLLHTKRDDNHKWMLVVGGYVGKETPWVICGAKWIGPQRPFYIPADSLDVHRGHTYRGWVRASRADHTCVLLQTRTLRDGNEWSCFSGHIIITLIKACMWARAGRVGGRGVAQERRSRVSPSVHRDDACWIPPADFD